MAMAAAVASAPSSLQLQLLRFVSSRLGRLYRLTPSARLQLKPAAAVSHHEAAAHGDGDIDVATSAPLEADVLAAAELRAGRKGAPTPPGGRPGLPVEGSGGNKHNAAPRPTLAARRVRVSPPPPGAPAEGSGGHGGSVNTASP